MDSNGTWSSIATAILLVKPNHAPVIEDMRPSNGSVFDTNMLIHFSVFATDEDGDILSYKWDITSRNGMTECRATREFEHRLGVGMYTIHIRVSDGTCEASNETTIQIRKEVHPGTSNASDQFCFAFLVIAVLIGAVAVIMYLRLLNDRKMQENESLQFNDKKGNGDEKPPK